MVNMREFLKRNRAAFEFLLFLFLVGISSGFGLTATGLFAPFGLSVLALFGAGAMIFGILMLPLLVLVPYIAYSENKHINRVKKEKLQEQKRQKKQTEQPEQQQQEKLQQKIVEEQRSFSEKQEEDETINSNKPIDAHVSRVSQIEKTPKRKSFEASVESDEETSEEVLKGRAEKAREKITEILKKAPKKFPLGENAPKPNGSLTIIDQSQRLGFFCPYEDQYFYVSGSKKKTFLQSQKVMLSEQADFFIAFIEAVFNVKLPFPQHENKVTEISSSDKLPYIQDKGHFFCEIDFESIEKIVMFEPEAVEKNAVEFYEEWRVKRALKGILNDWIDSIEDPQEEEIAVDIQKDILKHLLIEKKGDIFSLNYDKQRGSIIYTSSKFMKLRDDLFQKFKAYVETEEKNRVFSISLVYEQREGSVGETFQNLTIQIKSPVLEVNYTDSPQKKESPESSEFRATNRIGELLLRAPKEFPLRKKLEESLGPKNQTKNEQGAKNNDLSFESATKQTYLLRDFVGEVFDISLQIEIGESHVSCNFDEQSTRKINESDRTEVDQKATEFYRKWEEAERQTILLNNTSSFSNSPVSQPGQDQDKSINHSSVSEGVPPSEGINSNANLTRAH